jgi:UDP-2-acetamido-2-deoxy-ribo-hexuluronate aminotransferase
MKINLIDLQKQYQLYKKEIEECIKKVLESSSYIMGPEIGELERELAEYVGVKYAIGCSSGTDALFLALMSYDIKPGDEIITTPFTFIATAEVIALLGAKPIFVDIRKDTYNIDPDKIESKITKKTRGIITVDIFGQSADYDEINKIAKKNNLFVIEDACQSFGAEYKGKKACSLADIACTSFFPSKPLGCYGDGGMVFTDDVKLKDIMVSLRVHGSGKDKYDSVRIGLNARLDTLQAAILLVKFKYFNKEIKARQVIADHYSRGLKGNVVTPKILKYNISAFAQYCIRVDNRDKMSEHLKSHGISTAVYYPKSLHLQTAFEYLGYKAKSLPVSEEISRDILALPMGPYLTREEQDYIIEKINSIS